MKKIFTLTVLLFAAMAYPQLPAMQWAGSFGGTGNDIATGMAAAPDGSLYVTGNFEGTVDFDPGAGVTSLTADVLNSIFIQKLDAAGNLLWVKKINNRTNASTSQCYLDAQGNLLVTGSFSDTADLDPGTGVHEFIATGFVDVFIIKLDDSGNYVWGKNFASASNSWERTTTITLDAAGNIYATGTFDGSVTIGGTSFATNGGRDVFIQKMDALGNSIWVKSVGGISYENISALKVDADGNIFAGGVFGQTVDFDPGAGNYSLTAQGNYDGFIVKLDNAGNFVWARKVGEEAIDMITDLEITEQGDLMVTGSFASASLTFDFGPTSATLTKSGTNSSFADGLLLKMDGEGNYLWARHYGGDGDDSATNLAIDEMGKIYILGQFNQTVDFNDGNGVNTLTSEGQHDIYLQCLTADGEYEYAHRIGGALLDQARKVLYRNGSLYITGTFRDMINLNPAGTAVSAMAVGGDDYFICKFGSGNLGAGDFIKSSAITLYPNPSDGHFTLQGNGIEGAQITIYNQLGAAVRQFTVGDSSSAQHLTQGVYFVEIIANGKREVKKLIVK